MGYRNAPSKGEPLAKGQWNQVVGGSTARRGFGQGSDPDATPHGPSKLSTRRRARHDDDDIKAWLATAVGAAEVGIHADGQGPRDSRGAHDRDRTMAPNQRALRRVVNAACSQDAQPAGAGLTRAF